MKYEELTDPLHREAVEVYARWLNGWLVHNQDPDLINIEDFEVEVIHDGVWQQRLTEERTVSLAVDYAFDEGGAQLLWVYALKLTDGTVLLESLVQGFDTYVSIVMQSGEFQETWKE